MKLTFIIYYEHMDTQVMAMLKALDIDYYTRWSHVTGKGHGTEPHIGTGSYVRTNSALMIAFEDDAPRVALMQLIVAANEQARRPDERIRFFQVPLEHLV